MNNLFDMVVDFAKANGLEVALHDDFSDSVLRFKHEDGSEFNYRLNGYGRVSDFPKIVQAVSEYFGLIGRTEENKPVTVVQQHRTDICGLTKHEYIALELTKARASTRHSSYWDAEDTVNRYEEILKEVKERNL